MAEISGDDLEISLTNTLPYSSFNGFIDMGINTPKKSSFGWIFLYPHITKSKRRQNVMIGLYERLPYSAN